MSYKNKLYNRRNNLFLLHILSNLKQVIHVKKLQFTGAQVVRAGRDRLGTAW